MGAGNCPCDENDYPETDAIEGWDYKVDTPPQEQLLLIMRVVELQNQRASWP